MTFFQSRVSLLKINIYISNPNNKTFIALIIISAIYNFGMAFMLPKSIGCSHDQLLQGLLKTNPEEIKQNENRLFSVNMLNSFSVTLIILQDCG